jgi:predicted lipoprotein
MRQIILILAIALAVGTPQSRADMIAYNMTGTITQVMAARYSSLGVGDQISWTI